MEEDLAEGDLEVEVVVAEASADSEEALSEAVVQGVAGNFVSSHA